MVQRTQTDGNSDAPAGRQRVVQRERHGPQDVAGVRVRAAQVDPAEVVPRADGPVAGGVLGDERAGARRPRPQRARRVVQRAQHAGHVGEVLQALALARVEHRLHADQREQDGRARTGQPGRVPS